MESTHSRNVGIAKFVNDCLYDAKNPAQQKDPNIRNSINGFPALMYINDELQGVYNFNLDRYSTKSFGYTDPDKVLVYEISANSDTTAGAFYSWTEASGKDENAYYQSDYECLYPPTRAAGNDSLTELKRLIEWVDKSSDEDFKDNIGRYFNLEYLLRYYLYVLVFGAVDSLGKNAKIASFDGGLTWHFQVYDADTTCGLNNSGFLLFGTDIEMGDENVFNTTGSRLWQRVVFLFQDQLKEQYSLMRQGRFTVDNIMKYIYGEQISQIPATFYNKDMQTKYLNFGSSYLYALHGSGEKHFKRWIRERLMYVDTLLGYMVSSSDYITLRSNKLGYVYLDIQMYIPMYVTVKWRDEAGGTGVQTKRVAKGETVRFEYNMPTETDQEILVYAGHYIKSLGDVSNLQPSTMLIANANRLTEITCHSDNLINTDLSECKLLQKIDISDCVRLGTGIGAQPILNIENAKYLRYLDCRNTQLTAIYTRQSGSNLEEIYYPKSIQTINLSNQSYLRIVGIPYETDPLGNVISYCENLADVELNTCKNVEYLQYPYVEGERANLDAIRHVQNLTLIDSIDSLTSLSFKGFSKLKNLTLSTMHNISSLGFNDMLGYRDEASLESIKVSDCPLIDRLSFNISNVGYKVEFVDGASIDLGGMQSVKTIESNYSIKGLKTMIISTMLKELKFISEFGDGNNSIENIWSAASNHANDGFKGIDLLDVTLTYLDMSMLKNIQNAINFNISPTNQHPNMNTYRQNNFFKPNGVIDLTNYTGDMVNMLKGVDLSLLEIIVDKNQYQTDLSGLFENAILNADQIDKVNMILNKYNRSTNWSNMFKNANLGFNADEVNIPGENSYRLMNLSGMFYNTSVSNDIVMTKNLVDVSDMFRNCKNMINYIENWNKELYDGITTNNCYSGIGGNLDYVPTIWGGYGFFDDVTTVTIINVPTADYTVKLSTRNKTTTTYGIVNWGDGNINSVFDNDYSHTYEYPGVYTIKGHYTYGMGYVNNSSLSNIMTEVTHIATNSTDLANAFRYCYKLESVDLGELIVNNLKEAFAECNKLKNVNLSLINTSNVTNMSSMFVNCSSLNNLNLSNFDTSNVTTMNGMFNGCAGLNSLNLSNFNTEKVTDMNNLFYGCSGLKTLDISSFDTAKVTDMNGMFYNCSSLLELNVDHFVTNEVTNMGFMFNRCSTISTLNLENFITTNVTNMKQMFGYCENLQQLDLSNIDTTNVTDMESLFYNCKKIEQLNLSNFSTENVRTMAKMFNNCTNIKNINMTNWNTANVTDMNNMFNNCKSLTLIELSHFNTENVTDMSGMFLNCAGLFNLDISNFVTDKLTNIDNMFESCINLNEINLNNFNTSKVNSMRNVFYGCSNITSILLDTWDTGNVTNMKEMFYNCKKLANLNVSGFKVNKVRDMSSLFYNCNSLSNIDVSGWETEVVTNLPYLFYGCINISSIDVSKFITNNVSDMSYMFYNCNKLLKLDLNNFNTANVTNMSNMFYTCERLNELKIDNFNTDKVENMSYLFYNCTKLPSINTINWNTSKVTNMRNMFYGCESLTLLDLSHFDTNNVTSMNYMLGGLKCNVIFTEKTNNALKNANAMFNIYNGTHIDMSNFSLANSTNNGNFISIATKLVDFIPPTNINSSIKIAADNLSVESLLRILNNLNIVTKPQTLEIGLNNIAKLSEEEIAIAINKGWSVS